MSNKINFPLQYFMFLDGILPYAGLLQTIEGRYNKETNKTTWYIDFEKQEDINRFLDFAKGSVADCCDHISALSKALYYCNKKELEDIEVDQIIALMGSLGRFAAFFLRETEELTPENTRPKASLNTL